MLIPFVGKDMKIYVNILFLTQYYSTFANK